MESQVPNYRLDFLWYLDPNQKSAVAAVAAAAVVKISQKIQISISNLDFLWYLDPKFAGARFRDVTGAKLSQEIQITNSDLDFLWYLDHGL